MHECTNAANTLQATREGKWPIEAPVVAGAHAALQLNGPLLAPEPVRFTPRLVLKGLLARIVSTTKPTTVSATFVLFSSTRNIRYASWPWKQNDAANPETWLKIWAAQEDFCCRHKGEKRAEIHIQLHETELHLTCKNMTSCSNHSWCDPKVKRSWHSSLFQIKHWTKMFFLWK